MRGAQLEELVGFAPDVVGAQRRLAAIGQELPIEERDRPGLRAVVSTPTRRLVLT